jgi:glycosyltransferase involved in cell wall biosynthesis
VDLVSPVVLYMGKLEAAKGVFVLLDALVLLRKDVPSLRAVFAGSGPAAGELRRRIHALSLSKTIELRGFVDDAAALTALYNEASVAVVPSIEPEGFPRVVEEALLHGLPIIATRCGGLPHVFEGKAEVAFVETGNATGLAASIRDFALNPATRARMIEAAARAARERATRRSAAAQHSDAILGGRP